MVFDLPNSAVEAQLAILEKLPPGGADVILENDHKAGQIVSRSISPVLAAPVAFAYLDRANRTPGTKLKIKASDGTLITARVELLPFYRAADLKSRVTFLHDRAIRTFSEGNDDKAIELLVEALRLDPSFSDGYEALGVILGRTGRFHEAIGIFKQLEEVAPNEPMVNTNLSLYYMKIGDKQTAEDEKARATVKQFSRFGAMKKEEQRHAEETAQKKADAERKKAMFSEVLEIDPEDPIALFGLGNALSVLGDWAEAEKVLSRAISVQKDNSAVYVAHGKALEALNREADALEVYRAGMAVASKKGDLMPLKEMERRALLLEGALGKSARSDDTKP
jgi:Flp pilus assembly protein TadD